MEVGYLHGTRIVVASAFINIAGFVALVPIRHQPHFIRVGFECVYFINQVTVGVVHRFSFSNLVEFEFFGLRFISSKFYFFGRRLFCFIRLMKFCIVKS